jgi:type VI secretion system protein ImpJ
MGWQNRVVWSEGLFLQPQHFQQNDRYLERLVEGRSTALRAYGYGFSKLVVSEEQLLLGKIAITSATGLMPDGTPFDFPAWQDPPHALEIPDDAKNQRVVLTVPARRAETIETDASSSSESLARFSVAEYDAQDSNGGSEQTARLQVGKLRVRLALQSEALGPYVHLGVVHVDKRDGKKIVLDTAYAPPVLDIRAAAPLVAFVDGVLGMLHQRGDALAKLVSGVQRGAVAEFVDFLFLQVVNRYEALLGHFAQMSNLHPESVYQVALQMAGELASFGATRRPSVYPLYQHDNLRESFEPLLRDLRVALNVTPIQRAIAITVQERRFGYYVALLDDTSLLGDATFYLAVKANMRTEELVQGFPAQTIVAPGARIKPMVDSHLSGIDLRLLPVAPRHIPFHAGCSYFELDRGHPLWRELSESGGFALHVAGKFPGLEMELWAVRE